MPFQNTVLNYFTPSRNTAPFWTYGDTLSWTKGKHAFKFGGESRRNSVSIWDNGEGSNANPMATRTYRDRHALRSGHRHRQQHAVHVGRPHRSGRHRNDRQRSRHAAIAQFPLRIGWQRHTELLPEFIHGPEVVGYPELGLSAADDAAERVQFLCERRLENPTRSDAQSRRPLGLLRSSVGSERHDRGSRRWQQRGLWIFRTIV